MISAAGARVASLVLLVSLGCAGTEPPPDDTFDGNVIIGEPPADGGAPREAGVPDGGPDPVDAGSPEDASEPEDASPTDAGDPCAEAPALALTASAAVTRAELLAGQLIEVSGLPTQGELSCTDDVCGEEEPCCNTCQAEVSVDGILRLEASACFAIVPGCSGSECAVVCRPALLGVPQRFVGWLDPTGPTLQLQAVLP